jgi:ubiquinone/menaquinone biosynthesis C-methylase UbiE
LDYRDWNQVYESYPLEDLPWELGKPRDILVELVEKSKIRIGKALDICCGAGTNTTYLSQCGFEVVGIDISSRALRYSIEKAEKTEVSLSLLQTSFLNLPFQHDTFDFVFDMGCFHHVKLDDKEKFVKEVYRVLKITGDYLLICFSEKNLPEIENVFTKEQLIQTFSDLFEIKEIKPISNFENVIIHLEDLYVATKVERHFYSVLMKKNR